MYLGFHEETGRNPMKTPDIFRNFGVVLITAEMQKQTAASSQQFVGETNAVPLKFKGLAAVS